jgi:type II secretory pathway pseudopilin PulG
MLLAVLFMMAMMVIVAMAMAPSFVQQMKRDREEEMIHRGTEYARAIKKFYKKFGRYPANLEQLDNTNQIRFLRRRFSDPLSKDGQWKLLHYGDIQVLTGGLMRGAPGSQMGSPSPQMGAPGVQMPAKGGNQGLGSSTPQTPGASGSDQGASTAPAGAQLSPQQPGASFSSGDQTPSSVQTSGAASPFIAGGGGAAGQSGFSAGSGVGQGNNASGGQTAGAPGQTGSNNTIFGNTGVGGQTFGGGAIVGVASKDKETTIRLFNKKKTYDEWQFIYSPVLDRVNVLLRGPYNGQTLTGTQVGTPAGQLNQGNQGMPGPQPGGMTQPPGGFGQQNPVQNQQITPGSPFPPDQNQPQPQQ